MRPQYLLAFATFFAAFMVMHAGGMPTPTMSHEQMMEQADVVVEGEVVGVNLERREFNKVYPSYEEGDFSVWFLVDRTLKGSYQPNQTLQYRVNAYMEGPWSEPYRYFIYHGTGEAISPGTHLRLYLVWDKQEGQFKRVDFNSGFRVLKKSTDIPPREVGSPRFSKKWLKKH